MKKIITTIITLAATTALTIAGPLDGSWVNTDPKSKNLQKIEINGSNIIMRESIGSVTPLVHQLKLNLLGDNVSDKTPNKFAVAIDKTSIGDHYFLLKMNDTLIPANQILTLEQAVVFNPSVGKSNHLLTLQYRRETPPSDATASGTKPPKNPLGNP